MCINGEKILVWKVLWSGVCVDFRRLHVFTFSLCLTLSALALAFLVLISVLKLSFSVLLMPPPLTFVICAAADVENVDVKWGTNGYHYQGIIINLLLTPNLGLITTKGKQERARERSVSDKIPLQQMLNENEWANLKWTLLCIFLLGILSLFLSLNRQIKSVRKKNKNKKEKEEKLAIKWFKFC